MNLVLTPPTELVLPQHGLRLERVGRGWHARRFATSAFGPIGVVQDLPFVPPIEASGFVDGEEVDLLEDWLAATARPLAPSHVGLFTTTPADDGTGGVEVSGGAYARQAYARSGANWGNFVAGAPSQGDNLNAITFPKATANWGTVTAWGYFTALSAGTLLLFAVLGTSKAINTDDTAEIAAGDAIVKLGDPGDTF